MHFFFKLFPNLNPIWLIFRHWCIRKAREEAPICFIGSNSLEISARSGFSTETYKMMTYPNYRHLSQPQNLANTNNSINVGCFNSPNTNLFNNQCNTNMNLSINITNNRKFLDDENNNKINCNNINTLSDQTCQQPTNFKFQQPFQKKEPSDQTFRQHQFYCQISSSDTMDSPSEPIKNNIFLQTLNHF